MQIRIPEPCNENWDAMTPQDKGRYCSKCSKEVIDFTRMTDYSLVSYFKEHSDICGRFHEHQLNREIRILPPVSPWRSWFKKVAISGFFLTKALTDKAETNVIPEDSTVQHQVFQASQNIHTNITQPDSISHRATSLKFIINDFHIFIPLDSNGYSFSVPDSLANESISIELSTIDSNYRFQIDHTNSQYLYFQSGLDINFYYNANGWTYSIINPIIFTQPPIIQGIPPMPWLMGPSEINLKYLISGGNALLLGDTSAIDSSKNKDTTLHSKVIKKFIPTKRKSSPLWWLVPSFILIPILGWQIRKRLKNKRKPTQE